VDPFRKQQPGIYSAMIVPSASGEANNLVVLATNLDPDESIEIVNEERSDRSGTPPLAVKLEYPWLSGFGVSSCGTRELSSSGVKFRYP
jgi:hypothetical protein